MASWKGSRHVDIVAVHPRLFAITASLDDGKRLHSYVLLHDAGNLLFHGPDQVSFYKEHADFFTRHGGIAKHVLTHGAEASPACLYVERTLGAPVYLHHADVAYATKKAKAPMPASMFVIASTPISKPFRCLATRLASPAMCGFEPTAICFCRRHLHPACGTLDGLRASAPR